MSGIINEASNMIMIRQGDSFNILVSVKRGCKAVDLKDAIVRMQVKDIENSALIFEVIAEAIDVENGNVLLQITPQMSNHPVGDYKTDIQVEMPDGSINTVFPAEVNKIATFRITEQVTNG